MSQPRRYNQHMPAKQRHPAQVTASHKPTRKCLAAWITRSSSGRIKLVADTEQDKVQLEFEAFLQCEHSAIAIGEVSVSTGARNLAWSRLSVYRGRAGTKEPRPLYVFGPVTGDTQHDPAVRLRGKLRTAVVMLEAYPTQPPNASEIWLAYELAKNGFAQVSDLEHVKQAFGDTHIGLPQNTVRKDAWLLSNIYLEAQAQSLKRKLLRHPTANPFRTKLSGKAVSSLLHIEPLGLAQHILAYFASVNNLHKEGRGETLVVTLSPELLPYATTTVLHTSESIFKLYETEAGLPLAALRQHFASHLNVIQWLLEAGLLVENPSGFIFTQRQLLEYQRKLQAAGTGLRAASVRDIKTVLGLKRKPAEALRELASIEQEHTSWIVLHAATGELK